MTVFLSHQQDSHLVRMDKVSSYRFQVLITNSTAKSVPLGQMTEIVDAVVFQFVWCMNSYSIAQATCPFEVGQKHADANVCWLSFQTGKQSCGVQCCDFFRCETVAKELSHLWR